MTDLACRLGVTMLCYQAGVSAGLTQQPRADEAGPDPSLELAVVSQSPSGQHDASGSPVPSVWPFKKHISQSLGPVQTMLWWLSVEPGLHEETDRVGSVTFAHLAL